MAIEILLIQIGICEDVELLGWMTVSSSRPTQINIKEKSNCKRMLHSHEGTFFSSSYIDISVEFHLAG